MIAVGWVTNWCSGRGTMARLSAVSTEKWARSRTPLFTIFRLSKQQRAHEFDTVTLGTGRIFRGTEGGVVPSSREDGWSLSVDGT